MGKSEFWLALPKQNVVKNKFKHTHFKIKAKAYYMYGLSWIFKNI